MRLLKISAVAEALAVSESTVYSLVEKGDLASFNVGANGGAIRISEDDLQLFLESRKKEPAEKPRRTPRRTLKHIKLIPR